jgi:uracil-DNA glycosylase
MILEHLKTFNSYFSIMARISSLRAQGKEIYPPDDRILESLRMPQDTPIKVIIIGQDPYHGYNQANGLAFSVNKGMPLPPSLMNIFKEISADLGVPIPNHGDLTWWKDQGVLLLNTILTVEKGKPLSHAELGWQEFTNDIIKIMNDDLPNPVVFMLWGNEAKKKANLITDLRHLILTSGHPSPLSVSKFKGNKHFSKCNLFLMENGLDPIDWSLR